MVSSRSERVFSGTLGKCDINQISSLSSHSHEAHAFNPVNFWRWECPEGENPLDEQCHSPIPGSFVWKWWRTKKPGGMSWFKATILPSLTQVFYLLPHSICKQHVSSWYFLNLSNPAPKEERGGGNPEFQQAGKIKKNKINEHSNMKLLWVVTSQTNGMSGHLQIISVRDMTYKL